MRTLPNLEAVRPNIRERQCESMGTKASLTRSVAPKYVAICKPRSPSGALHAKDGLDSKDMMLKEVEPGANKTVTEI